jgi:hypothetical protein
MADGDGSRGHEDLPDVRGEPEPDWVEGIRRGREERAERLRSLLGGPPIGDAVDGDQDPVRDQTADAQDPPPGTPDPLAGTPGPPP